MLDRWHIGVAPHSLRAVTPDELDAAIAIAGDRPIHIHVAEQEKEVADCLAWSGARPVAWLLDHAPVDARWCLVHATHIDAAERQRLAHGPTRSLACARPRKPISATAFFRSREFLADGGRFGIGSDSNVSTSPVEELRWLEYIRRLQTQERRNVTQSVALTIRPSHWLAAHRHSAATPAPSRPAHWPIWWCWTPTIPPWSAVTGDSLLDAWLFSGNTTPVRDVMVAGRWVVRDGRHHAQHPIATAFARTMRRLADAL